MKKYLFGWMAVLMMAFMSIGFASCSSDDDDEPTSSIVGTWSSAASNNDEDYDILILNSNGSGTIQTIDQGHPHKAHPIVYNYAGTKLTIIYDDSDVEIFEVVGLSGNALTLKDKDGDTETFKRM